MIPANKIIKQDNSDVLFVVTSKSDPDVQYNVDMDLCTCSCPQGMDGSPCVHQAAIVKQHHSVSLNFVPTVNPSVRRNFAILALGDDAEKDISFYSSLHQQMYGVPDQEVTNPKPDEPDFSKCCWDLIRAGAQDEPIETVYDDATKDEEKRSQLFSSIDHIAEALKHGLCADDPQMNSGIEKFLSRFTTLSSFPSKARLASALHSFGSEKDGFSKSMKSGLIRKGKIIIKVQATATGRRKFGTKGRGPAQQGRPRTKKVAEARKQAKRYTLTVRRKNQTVQKGHILYPRRPNVFRGLDSRTGLTH